MVVLFKNKKRKKIIKSFVRKNVAELYFKKICDESDKIKFNVEVENSLDVTYEVGLLSKNIDTQFQLFSQDDIGRNVRVNLEDSDLQIIKISLLLAIAVGIHSMLHFNEEIHFNFNPLQGKFLPRYTM